MSELETLTFIIGGKEETLKQAPASYFNRKQFSNLLASVFNIKDGDNLDRDDIFLLPVDQFRKFVRIAVQDPDFKLRNLDLETEQNYTAGQAAVTLFFISVVETTATQALSKNGSLPSKKHGNSTPGKSKRSKGKS